jgi:hypothetical protein
MLITIDCFDLSYTIIFKLFKFHMSRKFPFALLIVAYVLLYPGLTQPLMSLSAMVDKADLAVIGKDIIIENPETPEFVSTLAQALVENMQIEGSVEAYNKTRSILGTVQELFSNDHALVAFLIALFSIVVPIVKGLILILSNLIKNESQAVSLDRFGALLSKWSMADVFVIGVFVAFLAANAVEKEAGLLTFEATLGAGFYYFLSYCLLSILASQLLGRSSKLGNE